MVKKSFGNALAKTREISDLTQEAAAEKIGVSLRYYQDLESGKKWPSDKTFEKIARAYGVPDPDLFVLSKKESLVTDTIEKLTEILKNQERELLQLSQQKLAVQNTKLETKLKTLEQKLGPGAVDKILNTNEDMGVIKALIAEIDSAKAKPIKKVRL